jgi:hypothetical protein
MTLVRGGALVARPEPQVTSEDADVVAVKDNPKVASRLVVISRRSWHKTLAPWVPIRDA